MNIKHWIIRKLGGVVMPTIKIRPEYLEVIQPELQSIMEAEFKKMVQEYDAGKFHKVVSENYGKSFPPQGTGRTFNKEFSQEDINKWFKRKSNKELTIENEETYLSKE